jgi:O-antigen/teichoic acid export membrane protein
VVTSVIAVLLIRGRLGIKPRIGIDLAVLRRTLRFAAASYFANAMNLLPLLVIPLFVLQGMGEAAAGSYFLAFQIALLLYTMAYSMGEALFAEGSSRDRDLRSLMRRSAVFLTMLSVPAAVVVAAGSRQIMLVFGAEYSARATGALIVLALSAVPVAFYTWATYLLRITRQLRAMVAANVVYGIVIISLVALWEHRGLVWVSLGWGVGNLVAGAVAAFFLARKLRRDRRELSAAPPIPQHETLTQDALTGGLHAG